MLSRLHKLAVLAAVLAAGALAPAALAHQSAAPGSAPVPLSQDLRSPDARDAALHPHYLRRRALPVSQDLRSPDARDAALHPHYLQPRPVPQPPTWPAHPQVLASPTARHAADSGSGGLGTAPLAGILAAAALAAAALAALARRRQARPVA